MKTNRIKSNVFNFARVLGPLASSTILACNGETSELITLAKLK